MKINCKTADPKLLARSSVSMVNLEEQKRKRDFANTLMYQGEFDSSAGVFYATLSGDVTVEELGESLRACFDQDYGGPVKSIWRISDMQINFALADATQLAAIFQAGGKRSGKMAFVSGDQGFIKSVVETVRSSRSDWGTEWQTFGNDDEALEWVSQS